MSTKKEPRGLLAILALVVLIWFAALGVTASLQTTGSTLPPLVIKSLDGRDLFQFYCATCHGKSGVGDGPIARALKSPPTNLTLLSKRNGGVFPDDRVRATIAGVGPDAPAATHGPAEMPVWGPIFRALDPDDGHAAVRIGNLVTFIQSLQAK
ncbi:MAG TPA: cytochrome c [Vicinamibacterales bacterium]|nr:cytochrome c [Vicinamibacterales bacterium]